VFTTMSKARLT